MIRQKIRSGIRMKRRLNPRVKSRQTDTFWRVLLVKKLATKGASLPICSFDGANGADARLKPAS
ncbi:hypothetical protein [Marivita sp. S2033]|uniref:hypothetical protein n=1 Tax=Marivita sp. S2033 TaxID=3373187 RepID=UPI0039826FD8